MTFEIADATARPGDPFDLSFTIHSDGGVQGFAFSADFDEEVLTGTRGESSSGKWPKPGLVTRSPISSSTIETTSPGSHGIDEGFFLGAAIFCFDRHVALPANTDVEVATFQFEVAEDAPEMTTQVRFFDGARGSGEPMHNSVVTAGETVLPEFLQSFVTVDCNVQVLPIVDIATFFLRGDSSGNGTVNITDAVVSLDYLFRTGSPPACFDAADADDDGELDITDPIFTLGFLFLGTVGPMPAPYPIPDSDPTPDAMTCRVRS